MIKLTKFSLFFLFATLASAQTAVSPGPASAPPLHALYRMFLRHVVALETAADLLDSQSNRGGAELRGWYQSVLLLSPQDTTLLKQNASKCVQTLDQQDAQAAQVIASALATGTRTAPATLAQLEDGRTAIANGCIQTLQGALTSDTFRSIDIFVQTAVARHFSATQPPLVAPPSSGGGK